MVATEATKFIELIDDWIATHEDRVDRHAPKDEGIVGVGVFYYEGPEADKVPIPRNESIKKARTRRAFFWPNLAVTEIRLAVAR